MKKLSMYLLTAATAFSVTGVMPATAFGATVTYRVPTGNGQMVVIGGNNMNDLQGVLGQLTGGMGIPGCDQVFPGMPNGGQLPDGSLPGFPGAGVPDNSLPVPEFPSPDMPELPNLPNLPEQPNMPGQPNQPDNTPDLPDSNPNQPDNGTSQDEFANRVVELVNAERAKAGLSSLTVDTKAASAAQKRAGEIQISFSHTRPDGSQFSTALTQVGASFRGAGENIAYGQQSPEEVMKVWMNSAGHRANILNGSFTSIGVGHIRSAAGVDYWTQMFMN